MLFVTFLIIILLIICIFLNFALPILSKTYLVYILLLIVSFVRGILIEKNVNK